MTAIDPPESLSANAGTLSETVDRIPRPSVAYLVIPAAVVAALLALSNRHGYHLDR